MLSIFPQSRKTYLLLTLAFSILLAVVTFDLLIKYRILGAVYAEQVNETTQRKTRKTPALRQHVYKGIAEAQEFSDTKEFGQALDVLSRLEKRPKLNSYENAMIFYLKGFAYYSQYDYPQSITEFQKIVGNTGVPIEFENRVLGTLAQLYFVVENYDKAIKTLLLLHKQQENPKSKTLFSLAQAYYLTKKYDQSIAVVKKVMALNRLAGKRIEQNTYLLLQGSYYEKKDFQNVADVLERLVEYYPKKQYWIQLGAVYSQMGLDEKQMSAMALAHQQGFLTKSSEHEMLAQLYMYHSLPYKAALLIDEAIKTKKMDSDKENLKMLADAWIMSKEADKAILALEKAAVLSRSGDIYERLVELYSEKEQWQDVIQISKKAADKAELKDAGRLYLLKGVAHFNLNEFEKARTALKKARKKPKTARFAKNWLRYVDREQQRIMFEESIGD